MEKFTKEQFCDYLKDHVQGYLPPSFDGAEITIQEVTKANDVHLTGMTIRRDGERIAPNIYLEQFYEEYRNGMDIDKIVGDVADIRIEYDRDTIPQSISNIESYESVKENLQIRLCDPEVNKARLSNLISRPVGEFAATYVIRIEDAGERLGTITVTPDLLKAWKITPEQLHMDAMAADDARKPLLSPLGDIMEQMMGGGEPRNLLNGDDPVIGSEGPNLYCLTVDDKTFGASLVARDDILQKIGDALNDHYFVLPSSIHEVLVVPETSSMSAAELSQMVHEINSTEVSNEDFLSDKVQFYDRDTGILMNAMQREAAKEMGRSGKRPSLTEQLAKKTEEVRNKPMKLDQPKFRNDVALG